jgi:hypothetical protein
MLLRRFQIGRLLEDDFLGPLARFVGALSWDEVQVPAHVPIIPSFAEFDSGSITSNCG